MHRGYSERLTSPGVTFDAAAIEQAIAAARELLARKGQPNVEPQALESAGILVPLFLEKLGRDVESAHGFLDYLAAFSTTADHSALALDAAQTVVARLRADPKRAEEPAPLKVS